MSAVDRACVPFLARTRLQTNPGIPRTPRQRPTRPDDEGFGAADRRLAAAAAARACLSPSPRRLVLLVAARRLQEFNVVATGKEDKLDMQLKAAYAAQNYSLVATMMQSGKVRACWAPAAAACRTCWFDWLTCLQQRQGTCCCNRAAEKCAGWRWVLQQPAAAAAANRSLQSRRVHLTLFHLALLLQLGLASTYKELVPGLNVTVSGTVPDVDSGVCACCTTLAVALPCNRTVARWGLLACCVLWTAMHGEQASSGPSPLQQTSLSTKHCLPCLAGKVAVVYTAIPHIHATAAATLTAAPKVDVAGGWDRAGQAGTPGGSRAARGRQAAATRARRRTMSWLQEGEQAARPLPPQRIKLCPPYSRSHHRLWRRDRGRRGLLRHRQVSHHQGDQKSGAALG